MWRSINRGATRARRPAVAGRGLSEGLGRTVEPAKSVFLRRETCHCLLEARCSQDLAGYEHGLASITRQDLNPLYAKVSRCSDSDWLSPGQRSPCSCRVVWATKPLVVDRHPGKRSSVDVEDANAKPSEDDFDCFGPPATRDGEFSGTKIADFGFFDQPIGPNDSRSDSNKYYHSAVVKSKKTGTWYAYFQWGRVGASSPSAATS